MRLTQSDVAGMVGASRERVNQVFVSLRGRKLLAVDKDYRVTLPDPEKLRELLRQR
jgi:CRP/FNR family cyclic AMP-dependent transcriptional regulator